jgi:hypothetical protein
VGGARYVTLADASTVGLAIGEGALAILVGFLLGAVWVLARAYAAHAPKCDDRRQRADEAAEP